LKQYVLTEEYRNDKRLLQKFASEARRIAMIAKAPELTIRIFKILWSRRIELENIELTDVPDWMKEELGL